MSPSIIISSFQSRCYHHHSFKGYSNTPSSQKYLTLTRLTLTSRFPPDLPQLLIRLLNFINCQERAGQTNWLSQGHDHVWRRWTQWLDFCLRLKTLFPYCYIPKCITISKTQCTSISRSLLEVFIDRLSIKVSIQSTERITKKMTNERKIHKQMMNQTPNYSDSISCSSASLPAAVLSPAEKRDVASSLHSFIGSTGSHRLNPIV